jgi:ABC-2 type transport system permease protein
LPNWIILSGYVTGAMTRGIMVGGVVTLVSLFFTRLEIQHPLITFSILILTSIVFALAGLINAIYARKFDDIAIVPTFILTPLTYLGGVFYSVNLLPEFWQKVSALNPILYMVNGFRFGILGVSDVELQHAYLIIVLFVFGLAGICLWLLHRGTGLRS